METLTEKYKLPKRIKLEDINTDTIGIVKLIKSRIIKKDAKKIVEISNAIKEVEPSKKVALVCTENICSKSKKLLEENEIEVVYREL